MSDTYGSADVLREDVRRQAVRAIVGNLDRLFLCLELQDDADGSKYLFLVDHHVALDICEECRLYKVSGAVSPLATSEELCAGGLARLYISKNALWIETY